MEPADLMDPDRQRLFLFDCFVWDNEAAQKETLYIKCAVVIAEYAKVACMFVLM